MVTKRAEPWNKAADREYPIRVKFAVPEGRTSQLGLAEPLEHWLAANLGPHMWNWGPAHSHAYSQATAYYFRRMEDAQRFVAAFPQLELADGVKAPMDATPQERVAHQGWSSHKRRD